MWHELMEKERAAAHALWARLDRLIPARHGRAATLATPPPDAAESAPAPEIQAPPPETKPPAV